MPEISRPPLFEALDRARPHVEAALEYSGGTHDWYDIVAGILSGTLQLWPTKSGALVTEVLTFPRKKVVNIFLGGGNLEELSDMHEEIITWAKANGCSSATISGRNGWKRAFSKLGWKPKHQTLEKEFE